MFIKWLDIQLYPISNICKNKKQQKIAHNVIILSFMCSILSLYSLDVKSNGLSGNGLWSEVIDPSSPAMNALVKETPDKALPRAYRTFRMNALPLQNALSRAAKIPTIISLPMPDGSFVKIQVEEHSILSPEFQERFPELRTYKGVGVDDSSITVRLDNTPMGFHAQLISKDGSIYINPADRAKGLYRSFHKRDMPMPQEPFQCQVESAKDETESTLSSTLDTSHFALLSTSTNPSGDILHTYRLAISATGEYYQTMKNRACTSSSPAECGMDATRAQIVTTINRVNGIYEREVSITMNLVAFNIYDDASTDPFDTGISGHVLDQNQDDLDDNVGSGNYDIGHVFSSANGGGLAAPGVCQSNKARGGTSLGDPTGDVFDVDYVAHEIGHQFSAMHTFNGSKGACSGSNRVADSAYEPGSGTTIMAYAGICGSQNVQSNSNDYFHARSFDQITHYRDSDSGNCGSTSNTDNDIPSVDAGGDHTIPRDTPFKLNASGFDLDGDTLTYGWEQFDLGGKQLGDLSSYSDGPLFRSRPPKEETWRTLPQFQDILNGITPEWEVLPSSDRMLTFRVIARDNLGGVDWDDMIVTVGSSPFKIDTPNSLECGASDTVTWDFESPLIASDVKAVFSFDDGVTFPMELIASTANDGSADVNVPKKLTNNGRVLLEPIDHIFFSVTRRFSITDTLSPLITPPADISGIQCSSTSGTSVLLGTAGVSDFCDSSPEIGNDAPDLFSLGITNVNWSATDESGNSESGIQKVEVVDTIKPSITVPQDLGAVECTSPAGATPSLEEAIVLDQCDSTLMVENNAPGIFPLYSPSGPTTTVLWTATDDSGNSATDTQDITVVDTTSPSIDAPIDLGAVECTSPQGASPLLGDAIVSDKCDASLTAANNAPGIFPLYSPSGPTTTVLWTTTDRSGNSASDAQMVTVVDTTAPFITAPADVVAECSSPIGTPANIGSATGTDICDLNVDISSDAPSLYNLGSNVVTWRAVDEIGNVATTTQNVTIQDTIPPAINSLTATPNMLWAANHKPVKVVVDIDISDACDADLLVRLVSIVSNEAGIDLGDGNTEKDIQGAEFGTDDREFKLRAERSGKGNDRIYTITYEVEDASGNMTSKSVDVVVPHSYE